MIDIASKLEKYRRDDYNNNEPSFGTQILAKNTILKMNELMGCEHHTVNNKAITLNYQEIKALFDFLPELKQWAEQFSA